MIKKNTLRSVFFIELYLDCARVNGFKRCAMLYLDLYYKLKEAFYEDRSKKEISELDLVLTHHQFSSRKAKQLLSGSDALCCDKHQTLFEKKIFYDIPLLETPDSAISSNIHFKYHVLQVGSVKPAKEVLLFFHGLNEKTWDKYLPWAYGLAKKTGKAVVLFPIAFHMDRAPELWSDRREMLRIAEERGASDLENSEYSFVNAAISSRMEAHPQRMFWSGLQTYTDVSDLIKLMRKGGLEEVDKECKIDLFGYSIGAFFSMMLLLSNPDGCFDESKLFCFCGGITIDRMFPISKYIMDGKSTVAMQECFSLLLNSDFIRDPRLRHYQDEDLHLEESWFKALLKYNYFQERRENRLRELEGRIKGFVLKNDLVIPAFEALNVLQGGYRDIDIEVEVEDFDHPYSHVMPFPLTIKNANEVDCSYRKLMDSAMNFYK